MPSSAGAVRGNSLTRIDPATGEIGASVFVGSEPNMMTVSDNGETIYVKLDGAKSVRRFEVPSRTAGLQFGLLGQFLNIEDWAVQPGNPNVLAISSYDGVVIFDNGVPRPNIDDGDAYSIETIAFDGPTTLYGADSNSLVRFTVSDSGVNGVNVRSGQGFGDQIEFVDGRIFTSGGGVYDGGGNRVGLFQNAGGPMAVDRQGGRVFFFNGMILRAYDMNTYAFIGSVTLPNILATGQKLVRWGANGLAVRGENALYLLQSQLISPNGAVPTGIRLGTGNYTWSEANQTIPITVNRSGEVSGTTTVDFATVDGTALAGADYIATAGTLTFGPGQTARTIQIPLINDSVYEGGSETFKIVLSNPGGSLAEIQGPDFLELTLTDNAPPPSIFTNNISVSEPAAGSAMAVFTARLIRQSVQTVTVDFSTANGTASMGSDYVATSGTLTFAPLETARIVSVPILADGNHNEPNETFRIKFTNAVNAGIGLAQATATIVNYVPVMVSISGRVLTPDGRGLRNAVVVLIDGYGNKGQPQQSRLAFARSTTSLRVDPLTR